jgi:putative inorganic carbon (hco3(-)) transporter
MLVTGAFWLLAAAVAASIATERALPLALGALVLQLATHTLAYGRPMVRTLADWPLLGLSAMALLSLLVTARMDLTAPQVGRLLLGIGFYYALASWVQSALRLQLVHLGFAATGLALALGALISVDWFGRQKLFFVPAELTARLTRLTADSVNPNVMAGYLALLLPIVLGPLLFQGRRMGWLRLGGLSMVLLAMLAVLLLTQSRAGLMAAGLGLVALSALRWRWFMALSLLGGGLAALALALGGAPLVLEFLGANVALGGLAQRQEIWSRAWMMIQDFSFTGIGMGSFAFVTDLLYPLFLSPPGIPHAHNLLLQVAVDLGVPGLVAYLASLVLVLVMAWQARRRLAANTELAGLAAGIIAAQVVLVAHGIFDAVTWGMVRPAVLVWAVWGTAAALWRFAQAPPEQAPGHRQASETE